MRSSSSSTTSSTTIATTTGNSTTAVMGSPPPIPLSPFASGAPKLKAEKPLPLWRRLRTPAIILSLLGAMVAYFNRGRLEGAALAVLHERLQRRPLSPQEIEDLRATNSVSCETLRTAFQRVDAAATTTRAGPGRVQASLLSRLLAVA